MNVSYQAQFIQTVSSAWAAFGGGATHKTPTINPPLKLCNQLVMDWEHDLGTMYKLIRRMHKQYNNVY